MNNTYYTLKDKRDSSFSATMTAKEIADYLEIQIWLDIYDINEQLKESNDGLAGYYIYELNRE